MLVLNMLVKDRVGNLLIGFLSKSLVFCKKWANPSFDTKNVSNSLIFCERPEQFAHNCSFLVSNLSELLTGFYFWWATWVICSLTGTLLSIATWAIHSHRSLKKREWANHCFFKTYHMFFLNVHKDTILLKIFEQIACFLWAKEQMSDSLKKIND